jgi:hypothetical protein
MRGFSARAAGTPTRSINGRIVRTRRYVVEEGLSDVCVTVLHGNISMAGGNPSGFWLSVESRKSMAKVVAPIY